MLRPRRVVTSLVLVGVALSAAVQPTGAQTLEDARQRTSELRAEVEAFTVRYESVLVEVENAVQDLETLERRERTLEQEYASFDERLATRARTIFKHGSTRTFDALLAAEAPIDGIERASMFAVVQRRDQAGLEEVIAARDSYLQARALSVAQRDRLATLELELDAARRLLEQQLAQAEIVAQSIEDRDSRQRRITEGSQQGVYACPMSPQVTHFIDSWGHARSGGRGHRGTDMMGPMNAPVYAFVSGVVERRANSQLGGLSLYLRGDDGSTYFYAHLNGYTDLGSAGVRVVAGDHIAFNGNTGNARGGAPHIHFERHPGGGAAVNPYQWLARACF